MDTSHIHRIPYHEVLYMKSLLFSALPRIFYSRRHATTLVRTSIAYNTPTWRDPDLQTIAPLLSVCVFSWFYVQTLT